MLKAVLLGTAVMGGVYSNWFCMMVFARVIGGYVRMTRLCNTGTGYSGTVGMYYHDKFGLCVGLREYEYISGWIEGWCEDVGWGRGGGISGGSRSNKRLVNQMKIRSRRNDCVVYSIDYSWRCIEPIR